MHGSVTRGRRGIITIRGGREGYTPAPREFITRLRIVIISLNKRAISLFILSLSQFSLVFFFFFKNSLHIFLCGTHVCVWLYTPLVKSPAITCSPLVGCRTLDLIKLPHKSTPTHTHTPCATLINAPLISNIARLVTRLLALKTIFFFSFFL